MLANSFSQNIANQYRRYYMSISPIMADPLVRGTFSLVASLIFVTLLIFLALSPTVNTILSLHQKVSEQDKLQKDMDTKIQSLIDAQQKYSIVEKDIPLLAQALPPTALPQVVIKGLLDSANEANVKLTNLQIKGVPLNNSSDKKGLLTVGFSATLVGSQSQLFSFLSALETRLRYIRIMNVVTQGTTTDMDGVGYFYEAQ